MIKELSFMTLEELRELFPIFLVEHNDKWKDYYLEAELLLQNILAEYGPERISHIGSTAAAGIWAKNIVDILVEFPEACRLAAAAASLEEHGFIKMSEEPKRISLNCGYTKYGFAEKVYHIHLRYAGDNDELYFRDYLNEHPRAAKEYEALKLRLWKEFEHNRNGYTAAKTEFVARYTAEAKKEFGRRY